MSASTTDPKKILRELVALPSVHPEADAVGTVPGEAAMAGWMADHLRTLGAAVKISLIAPGRPSVVGVFEPARKARATVVFAPHLDTVGVRGMTAPAFKLTEKNGRLHGRGACDTKGPTAAMLAAVGAWLKSAERRTADIRWVVAATAGEEQGSLGAQALVKAGFRADFAVALEPTDLKVVSAAKGVLRVWIAVPGRAAHGAKPERGDNAVYRALPLVQALKDELAPWLAAQRHPVLGGCSLNLGILQGGGELNMVPALCRIGLDIRVHPGCSAAEVRRRIAELVATHAPKAKVSLHREGPAFVTEKTAPWARRLRAVGRGWAAADWFCDANIFAAQGMPAVAFGPGSIRQAHTKNEFIEERELLAGAAAFGAFMRSGGGG
ncbi:MAG: M20/M25/M40 family metallo-hydrolase [Verrucomicrobia bacterium]|nr:M20/M25/M40 family metallo-hydrolase [Verrucomicrobiota bacterium]